jgi:serine phosphatase RsbU (regulator of sigma subunit)
MARTPKAFDSWKEMKPAALRRVALAVFLMFGVLGPLTILMESEMRTLSWSFVAVQTLASGGMAASIILFGRKHWWMIVIVILFWTGVLGLNAGGIGIIFTDKGMRVELNGVNREVPTPQPDRGRSLSAEELNAIYTQRGVIGFVAIALLSLGYAAFISVVRTEVRQRARLETEMSIAQEIQQSLLPAPTLETSWVRIAGTMLPATEVGGDFFDVVQLSDDVVAVAVADVTGHGVGAGILSAMAKSALHSQLRHDPAPASVLTNLNATLYAVSGEKMFVTFAYILLDRSGKTATVATAGHPPLFHHRKGEATAAQVRTASLGLGIRPESTYSSVTLSWEPGDRFFCYTDGLIEAATPRGEQFGLERLQPSFAGSTGTPAQVCAGLLASLKAFTGTAVFPDDLTAVCIVLT